MNIMEIVLIGVALSMDAAAVTMTNGMTYKNIKWPMFLSMPLFYGLFQALMPILGYYTGSLFAGIASDISGPIVFLVLSVLGIRMIGSAASQDKDDVHVPELSYQVLLVQAIATSIDALAVGFSFAITATNIFFAAATIGLITFFCTLVGALVGKGFGNLLGKKAELLGGVILIVIALRALFS